MAAVAGAVALASRGNFAVLNAKGAIAAEQKELMIVATVLMLLIIVPVFALTFHIAWKYRASNTKKVAYTPDWASNYKLEALWWGFPTLIIAILSVMIWQSSHSLDPFKPLASNVKPLTIQVVALQWKWLFILPEQGIASVNYLQVPEDTPLNFEITADAPMNSFWVPQLGGQVYAMSGMTTKLHLIADEPGAYRGSSANLSGEGFSDMDFTVRAGSPAEFDRWVAQVKADGENLNLGSYANLALPAVAKDTPSFGSTAEDLHSTIVNKYAAPGGGHEHHDTPKTPKNGASQHGDH